MYPEQLFALVFVLGMFGGVFLVFQAMRQRSQYLEMQHRERMAMIERGQIPLDRAASAPQGAAPGDRSMTLGIVIAAAGLALMMLIAFAGESPESGLGVGGAVAIIGAGFIANSLVARSRQAPPPYARPPLPPE